MKTSKLILFFVLSLMLIGVAEAKGRKQFHPALQTEFGLHLNDEVLGLRKTPIDHLGLNLRGGLWLNKHHLQVGTRFTTRYLLADSFSSNRSCLTCSTPFELLDLVGQDYMLELDMRVYPFKTNLFINPYLGADVGTYLSPATQDFGASIGVNAGIDWTFLVLAKGRKGFAMGGLNTELSWDTRRQFALSLNLLWRINLFS